MDGLSMTEVCKNPNCHHKLKPGNKSGYCTRHIPKASIRTPIKDTAHKRVIIAGVDEGSNANGSHMARQVSVAREPWL